MKKIRLLGLLLLVASCGPQYRTTYEVVPPPTETGRMCANNCLLSQQNCQQTCHMQDQQCQQIQHLQARNDYLAYVNEQQRTGKPIKKSENNFYSSYACQSSACEANCGSAYQICHTNCGGQIIPHTYCTANCN